MPRVRFVWRKVDEEDARIASEICSAASDTASQRHRWLDYFEAFLRENPNYREKSTHVIVSAMSAQWLRADNQPSSMAVMVDFFFQFRVNPNNVDRARERVDAQRVVSGIRRMADNRGRIRPRRLPTCFLPGVHELEPEDEGECNRQSFWALACVTGNRCGNILYVRKLTVKQDGVVVEWGQRKVYSGVKVKYLFVWSAKPPDWILRRWADYNQNGWPFPPGCDMASSMQRWLEKSGLDLDSTSMREYMDEQTFRPLVLRGRMLPEEYALIMDHDIKTSMKHYAGGHPGGTQ